MARVTRRKLRDNNPALTNVIVRAWNFLSKCLRNWISHCVNPDRATLAKSFVERPNSILIDDLEAHLAGGAGDDAEGGFVIARIQVFGFRFHDIHDLFARDFSNFLFVRLF